MTNKSNIMRRLKSGSIKQTSLAYFVSKNLLFWICMVVSTVVGVVSISHIIENLSYTFDTEISMGSTAPLQLFWIGVLITATFIGWRLARSTDQLYKYRPVIVILFSILISVVGGLLLFGFNGQVIVNNALYKNNVHFEKMYRYTVNQMITENPQVFELLLEREQLRTNCLKKQVDDCDFE